MNSKLKVSLPFWKVSRLSGNGPQLSRPWRRQNRLSPICPRESLYHSQARDNRANLPWDSIASLCSERVPAKSRWHGTLKALKLNFTILFPITIQFSGIKKRPAEWDASCSRAWGELTGGCHTSSAGIALRYHMFCCTCSRCPMGSSPRPHVQGWVSCSHTPQPDTTETHKRATLSKATCAPKGLLPFLVSKLILKFPWNWNISGCACFLTFAQLGASNLPGVWSHRFFQEMCSMEIF